MKRATGTFDVKSSPDGRPETIDGLTIARITIEKRFRGALEGTSVVKMMAIGSDQTGAGAYVAIENVSGTLDGRTGTFVLTQKGIRTRDGQQLVVTVAPGLSSGELAGLSGEMTITIEGDDHHYDLDYTLDA
jgi:hypothetical protein